MKSSNKVTYDAANNMTIVDVGVPGFVTARLAFNGRLPDENTARISQTLSDLTRTVIADVSAKQEASIDMASMQKLTLGGPKL